MDLDQIGNAHRQDVALNGGTDRRRCGVCRIELILIREHGEIGYSVGRQHSHGIAFNWVVRSGRRCLLDRKSTIRGGHSAITKKHCADQRLASGPQRRVRRRLVTSARNTGDSSPVEIGAPLVRHLVIGILVSRRKRTCVHFDALQITGTPIPGGLIECTDVQARHGVLHVHVERSKTTDRH